MTCNRDDKNPVISFDRQMHDLYELAQDKYTESGYIDWDKGISVVARIAIFQAYADGVKSTLDWLRGEGPYPFFIEGEDLVDDDRDLADCFEKRELAPTAGELFKAADIEWKK